MNSRVGFRASRWLTHSQEASALEKNNSVQTEIDFLSSTFKPSEFFIPGWKGEGLISSSAIQIKTTINNLTIDALSHYKTFNQSNRTLKLYVYNEFQVYAQFKNLELKNLKNFNDFWFHFQDHTSPYREELENFSKVYCFRAVAIYLFRIKFLLDLARELNLKVIDENLINPLSFLGKIFKKDSSTELNCECLSSNQYSWYRPSFEYKQEVVKLSDVFQNITLTELIKIFSTTETDRIYSLSNYSHSLSHVALGQLINELSIKLPKWLNPVKDKNSSPFSAHIKSKNIKTLNTLFSGNNISSLALSHWLAQDRNMKEHWDHLICPDFKGNEFTEGIYFKICQELQFLSFLSKIASEQNYETVPFICRIMKEKYHANEEYIQASFLQEAIGHQEIMYDRIVLNLTDLPKTNPHFYVIQQITNLRSSLKTSGHIILLTNQKLFVPSQNEKVEQLLKDFKIECQFNFEDLKGKGELAQYLFVLTKRHAAKVEQNKLTFQAPREQKESCHSFIFSGELSRFNKMHSFVDELKQFLIQKSSQASTFYQKNVDDKLSFEYHIDAIIEGKLLSSSTKETMPKLHSNFFKNLYHSCIGLENFFHIDQIDPQLHHGNSPHLPNELLGLKTIKQKHPLILIVNASSATNIKIELLDASLYEAKLNQYGSAYYSYFGLTEKIKDINLNVFREYFQSRIGHQVIQLQLSDVQSKLKAKLKSLLIPKFFLQTNFISTHDLGFLDFFISDKSALLSYSPKDLELYFSRAIQKSELHQKEYAWHILGLLSFFNVNISNLVTDGFGNFPNRLNFNNPLILEPLLKLKTSTIYPKNNDVYLEFLISSPNELHNQLTSLVQKTENDETATLTLKYGNKDILVLHSKASMIGFLKFILESALGHKISDIITTVQIPDLNELDNIIKNYSGLEETFLDLKNKTEQHIEKLLNASINSQL